jgi:hypothetical protein
MPIRIRILLFTSIRIQIRILLLFEVIEILEHRYVDFPGLHFKPPGGLRFDFSVHGPSTVSL